MATKPAGATPARATPPFTPTERETAKAIAACWDYLRMGPGRSIEKLHQTYTKTAPVKPPAKSLRWLKEWSRKYGWQERARAYDAKQATARDALVEATMRDGLALPARRVDALKRLALDLEAQLFEETTATPKDEDARFATRPKLWLRDEKQIGGGEFATSVVVYRFNTALVREYRATLADLAAETGGRQPVEGEDQVADTSGFTEALDAAADQLGPALWDGLDVVDAVVLDENESAETDEEDDG